MSKASVSVYKMSGAELDARVELLTGIHKAATEMDGADRLIWYLEHNGWEHEAVPCMAKLLPRRVREAAACLGWDERKGVSLASLRRPDRPDIILAAGEHSFEAMARAVLLALAPAGTGEGLRCRVSGPASGLVVDGTLWSATALRMLIEQSRQLAAEGRLLIGAGDYMAVPLTEETALGRVLACGAVAGRTWWDIEVLPADATAIAKTARQRDDLRALLLGAAVLSIAVGMQAGLPAVSVRAVPAQPAAALEAVLTFCDRAGLAGRLLGWLDRLARREMVVVQLFGPSRAAPTLVDVLGERAGVVTWDASCWRVTTIKVRREGSRTPMEVLRGDLLTPIIDDVLTRAGHAAGAVSLEAAGLLPLKVERGEQ